MPRTTALVGLPVVFYGLLRRRRRACRGCVALYEVRPGVRLGAAVAVAVHAPVYRDVAAAADDSWRRVSGVRRRRCSSRRWSSAGQLAQFGQWAADRTYKNYLASVELGTLLPPGTLVHGKLANGLALENRHQAGLRRARLRQLRRPEERDDVRYILTYVAP